MKAQKPELRFPEFSDNWEIQKIGEIIRKASEPVKVEDDENYQQIGIRSHGKGLFHKAFVTGLELGNKRVFWVKENLFIVNIVFAWEQAVAKTTSKEIGMIASHRFPMFTPLNGKADIDYLVHFFLTPKSKGLLELASPGGAGRNKTLGQKEFDNLKFPIPTQAEQIKIANFLTKCNERINLLKEKQSLLEQYKKSIIQQFLTQEIKFKQENGSDFPKWTEKKLGELLDYEQPTKYLVSSTDYNDNYNTPVLTAGKKFILGYTNEIDGIFSEGLPVIIFDDFTTSCKFVNFPFKAKSSAMKILSPKKDINIYFVYEAMKMVDYTIGGHERHWISKYSILTVPFPSIEEQKKIADFLSKIDNKVEYVKTQIAETQQYKKGLLQQLFC